MCIWLLRILAPKIRNNCIKLNKYLLVTASEMDAFPNVIVVFNEREYKITVSKYSKVRDLKNKVFPLIGLEPERQRIANVQFDVLGNKPENSWRITEILKCKRFQNRVTKFMIEEQVGTSRTHRIQIQQGKETEKDKDGDDDDDDLVKEHRGRGVCDITSGFKFMARSRRHKKLLVLDIDSTLCRYSSIQGFVPRPHLQEFLTGVYPYYNLALWSSTEMHSIEQKVERLGIQNKTNYNFLFYLDGTAMTYVQALNKERIKTKPLQKIYNIFQQFSGKNTLICDDQLHNLHCNPRNGLLIKKYYLNIRGADRELLLLKKYLMRIANESDLSILDHSKWRETAQVEEFEENLSSD